MLPSPFVPSPNEATRPIAAPRAKSSASSRFWKWKTRSSRKSTSEVEAQELSHTSPTASLPSPLSNFTGPNAHQVASPYLSESAHVLSLQHPAGRVEPHESDQSGAVTPKSKEATVKTAEDPTLMGTRDDARQSISQTDARSVGPKDVDSREANGSKIDDYFLLPPGISSQPPPEHDEDDGEITESVIQNLEELEQVSCGPAKTVPSGSFWSDGFRKRGSRLKFHGRLSNFTHKFLKRRRFPSRSRCRSLCSMTKSRRSSGGTNKVALLDKSHSTNSELLPSAS
ncbi:hypothetical protein E4U54_008561 [Claviceps lovelessii]|nr:hypothetical protein E4U54_008561 [Claviceps lovelessii]